MDRQGIELPFMAKSSIFKGFGLKTSSIKLEGNEALNFFMLSSSIMLYGCKLDMDLVWCMQVYVVTFWIFSW